MEKHFKLYNDLLYRINVKNMELIQLKENWYSISGVRYKDVVVQGGKPVDIADQLHIIIEKEKDLKGIVAYKEELRRIHEQEIDKLEDYNKRAILKLFYLDHCTINQIARCLHFSEPHVKRLKRKAVIEFMSKNKDTK